jgi:hypothetical protein
MSKRKWFGNSKKVWRRNSNKIEEFSKKWGQHPIIAPWSRRRTKTSLVRSCISILVIRSEKHEYEASGLGCHPKTMFFTRSMKFRTTSKAWKSIRQDRFIPWMSVNLCRPMLSVGNI